MHKVADVGQCNRTEGSPRGDPARLCRRPTRLQVENRAARAEVNHEVAAPGVGAGDYPGVAMQLDGFAIADALDAGNVQRVTCVTGAWLKASSCRGWRNCTW